MNFLLLSIYSTNSLLFSFFCSKIFSDTNSSRIPLPDPSPGSGCRLSCIVCFYSAVLEDVEAVPVLLVDVVSVLPDVVLSDVVLSVVVPSVESVEALSTVIVYRSASVTSSFFQFDATLISLSFTHPSNVSLYLSDLRLEMIVCLLDSVLSSSNALSTRIT